MIVLRVLVNLILALALIAVSCAILLVGYSYAASRTWEYAGLDEGAENAEWLWVGDEATGSEPIHYRIWGSQTGPWVVLVHGQGVEGLLVWEDLARALARSGARVLAIDLPGFGRSTRNPSVGYSLSAHAGVLAEALDQLQIDRATVVGQGWGCAVALQLYSLRPQLFASMASLSPELGATNGLLSRILLRLPHMGRATVWATQAGGPLWALRYRSMFENPSDAEEYLEHARALSRIVGTLDCWAAMGIAPQAETLSIAGAVDVPVLIAIGEHDTRTAVRWGERLVKKFPNAVLVELPEAGPSLHIERATEVGRQLINLALDTQ